jgi:hypothetical protein
MRVAKMVRSQLLILINPSRSRLPYRLLLVARYSTVQLNNGFDQIISKERRLLSSDHLLRGKAGDHCCYVAAYRKNSQVTAFGRKQPVTTDHFRPKLPVGKWQ